MEPAGQVAAEGPDYINPYTPLDTLNGVFTLVAATGLQEIPDDWQVSSSPAREQL